MEEKLLRQEEAIKIAKNIKDKYELDKIAEMIKSNTISFSYKNKDYRVRLLNQKEKDELDLFRREKFGELMQDKNILFAKELIKLYKEKGLDIEKDIDDKVNKIMTEVKDKRMKLGEALEKKEEESILKVYSDEIEDLLDEAAGLIRQKSSLLENSFEKTLEDQVIKCLAYLSLEIKIEDKYEKAFKNINDFLIFDEELIENTIVYSMSLHYRI